MAVAPDRVRQLALALEGAREAPHMHRAAFRTPRKIFITLGAGTRDVTFMFDPDLRDFYCEQAPEAFSPVPGGWGRMGMTACDLKAVDEPTFISALGAAFALAQPRPKRR
ncbi:MAG: MmcQ/YjbR family DNA-binding protein [Caulobacteraceae bacterium]